MKKSAIWIFCCLLLLFVPSSLQAGEDLESPTTITLDLPEIPDVPEPNWLDRGSIWTFAWYDVSDESNGLGLRLGYDLAKNLRVRIDYLLEGFDFESGVLTDDAEATISMRYGVFESATVFPYLIAGGGSAELASFEFEYLIGAGVDYEFDNGLRIFAEFLHIRTESGDTGDRNEVRIGAGIPFSSIGTLNPFAKKF